MNAGIQLRSLAFTLLCAPLAAQSTYTLTPIVPPVPFSWTYPTGIDEQGNVLLNVFLSSTGPRELWVLGPAGDRRLHLTPSVFQPLATDLSDFGRVLGTMLRHPTVWDASGQPRMLRPLSSQYESLVVAGNSAGWLVGRAMGPGGWDAGGSGPVLWIGDQLVALDSPGTALTAWCEDINEQGRIVGASTQLIFPSTSRVEGWVRDGLQPPVGIGWPANHQENFLLSVNHAGEAVGYANVDGGLPFGFRWNSGVFTDVPGSHALHEIARDGTALGTLEWWNPALAEPIVSIGEQSWRLQDLLDPTSGAGWNLIYADDMNNAGQIVCDAFDPQGVRRGCVLTPAQGISTPGVARRPRTAVQVAQLEPTILELRKRLDPRH